MEKKELEKQNFLALFSYASPDEIEKSKGTGKKALKRLFNEYSDEIKKINRSKFLYKSILQHNAKVQKLDISLKISR